MHMTMLQSISVAALAPVLALTLQGCFSSKPLEDLPTEVTVTCGDGCDVNYSCTEEGKVETKASGCTAAYMKEIDASIIKDAGDIENCKIRIDVQKTTWEASKDMYCKTLQSSPTAEVDCGGGCTVTLTCTEDDKEQFKATGCKKTEPVEKEKAYNFCVDEIKSGKDAIGFSCYDFTGEMSVLADDASVSEIASSTTAPSSTEEKGLYMLLGGALVAMLYLLFKGIVAATASSREARAAKLVTATTTEKTEAEMRQVIATVP